MNYVVKGLAKGKYLELFLKNLLLGEDNILSNREMHIAYKDIEEKPKTISDREKLILELIRDNPQITLVEISEKIDKSLRTVNNTMKVLQEKGIIERVGGKKVGSWKIEN